VIFVEDKVRWLLRLPKRSGGQGRNPYVC